MVKPKDFNDLIRDDPSLLQPLDVMKIKIGFDDSGIEGAYQSYKEFIYEERIMAYE